MQSIYDTGCNTGAFGVGLSSLALLAMPLLFIELGVAIVFVTVTLANLPKDRSRPSRGQLPSRPGQQPTG